MKKRIFSIFLCMVLILGLAACGNSDTSQTNAQENDEKKEQDASQEGTEPEVPYPMDHAELEKVSTEE